ncbi:Thiopurine S-methyltransferase [compost metagenome]
MDEQFWQARWAENQIGFHQRETNPYLERYWSQLQLPTGCQVLVPLCGKTLDMLWKTSSPSSN